MLNPLCTRLQSKRTEPSFIQFLHKHCKELTCSWFACNYWFIQNILITMVIMFSIGYRTILKAVDNCTGVSDEIENWTRMA